MVIDYDQAAFQSAAALEKREIKAIHKASGRSMTFKNRTEFYGKKKNSLEGSWLGDQNTMREAKGQRPFSKDEFDIEDVQIASEVSHTLYECKRRIENYCKHLGIEDYFGVIGKGETFRHELPLPQKYKSNRDTALRPLLLTEAKDYLVEYHEGKIVTGIEADDMLTRYGYRGWLDYKKTGKFSYLVGTMDKDQRGTPCLYFDIFAQKGKFRDPDPILIDDGLGEIWLQKGEVKGYGAKWLAVQMCKGDESDHVRPYQDFGIVYGDTSCYHDFHDAKSAKDLFTRVLNRFVEWFPDGVEYDAWNGEHIKMNSLEWANMMFKLVYMHRIKDDHTTFTKLLQHYGILK